VLATESCAESSALITALQKHIWGVGAYIRTYYFYIYNSYLHT
jgi:hypothetical protein